MTPCPLHTISDDDLISEVQRRLDTGCMGYEGLMSSYQCNYRDMWCALSGRVSDWRNGSHEAFLRYEPIAREMHRLADERPNPHVVFALATTRYGREEMRGG